MYGSMVDIQSAMAENRRGKKRKTKDRRKKKSQDENIMACPIPYVGHKKYTDTDANAAVERCC